MLGPVTISRRRSCASVTSLGMKLSTCPSTTGCRPPRIAMPDSATNVGRVRRSASARSARLASTSSVASAVAALLQHGNRRRQVVQQPLEQPLLPRQRSLLRGQRLVLEGLQFRRDVALGVLERLPAAVVVGNLLDVRVGDFDVEAVHAVVFDLEIGDAGAFALARLQRHEELAAVRVDRAQFVQFAVETGRDHAAVADQCRGLGSDCPRQQRRPLRVDIEAAGARRAAAARRWSPPLRAGRAAGPACRAGPPDRAASRCAARCGRRRARRRWSSSSPPRVRGQRVRWHAARPLASCRAEAFACDRSGCVSQTRNNRLPAAVAQPSSSENSVGAASPDNVAVISRLRRDAGSRATNSLAVSTVSARIWASADICVVLA